MRKFSRSRGLTASETVLAELCDRSFLSLWSYPNLYRTPQKELCDLLVVFDTTVIIFSDKSCAYKKTDDPQVDWKRWFRKSILDSAHQIRRTEGWIRNHPRRVFLDPACTEPLPFDLPGSPRLEVFRICVASGGPTLKIDYTIQDDERIGTVGRIGKESGWIHVVDGDQLQKLLAELSTAGDFIDYLRKKEKALHQGKIQSANNELDIVACYVHKNRTFPAEWQNAVLPSGIWDNLLSKPEYQARIELDRISYIWDAIIERLIQHFVASELEVGNDLPVADFEKKARIMARERRFTRRVLARWIVERIERAQSERIAIGSAICPTGVLYVLLIGTGSSREEHPEYRKARLASLFERCHAAKDLHPEPRYVLGIAMDASGGRGGSEDFVLLDTKDWTDKDMQLAKEIRSKGKFFRGERKRVIEDEYVSHFPVPPHRKRPRPNEPCYCGSGIKFKKCCGQRTH